MIMGTGYLTERRADHGFTTLAEIPVVTAAEARGMFIDQQQEVDQSDKLFKFVFIRLILG